MRKYKPATFQPTVRPDWGGVLSYIPESEKSSILEAIIKYPSVYCESRFWLDTIKPDLDLQYEEFTRQCEAKSRGVRNRWGKTSITPVKDNYDTSITPVIVSEGEGIGIGEGEGKKERERESKIQLGDVNDFETLFSFWEQNKKGSVYKTKESRQRMLDRLIKLTGNNFNFAKEAILFCIDSGYCGFCNGNKLFYNNNTSKPNNACSEFCNENGIPY